MNSTIFAQIFGCLLLLFSWVMLLSCSAGVTLKKYTTFRRFFELALACFHCVLFFSLLIYLFAMSGEVQFISLFFEKTHMILKIQGDAHLAQVVTHSVQVVNESILLLPLAAVLLGIALGRHANRTGFIPPDSVRPDAIPS